MGEVEGREMVVMVMTLVMRLFASLAPHFERKKRLGVG